MERLRSRLKRFFGPISRPAPELRDQEAALVVVGPVIGKVTSNTARLLLELEKPARVAVGLELEEPAGDVAIERSLSRRKRRRKWKIRLHQQGKNTENGSSHRLVVDAEAGRPFVVQFRGLVPGAKYRVVLEGCRLRDPSIRCSFRTFPDDGDVRAWETLNVAVVSCNKVFVTQQGFPAGSDLWEDLAMRVETGEVDLVLHLGDQVYGDGDKIIDEEAGQNPDKWSDRFRSCKELLKDVPRESWLTMQPQVCESYRGVYRETWGAQVATARCLAGCPNLMIYDDHEIRDNWADLEADWDPSTLDFFIARCAWIVYLEYQRQLYEDIDFTCLDSIKSDHHFHVIGGIGLMFLDVRGCRSFHRVQGDECHFLGTRQWRDIDASLQSGGLFDGVKLLLVCTPAPLVFLEPHITDAAGKNVPRLVDFRGHWSANPHIKEQIRMIETLWEWKSDPRRQREVFVLGGDVHCGGHSHILKDQKVIFNQLTTSAIANRPLPKAAYYFMRAAGRLGKLENGLGFRHHHWTRSRNYGLIQIRNYARQKDPAEVELVSYLVIGKRAGLVQGKRIKTSYVNKVKCYCLA